MKKRLLFIASLTLLANAQMPTATILAHESAESSSQEHDHNHEHEHEHDHDHGKKPHQEGIFEDEEVQDRELSDWEGQWQSVFPYLQDGTLDEVMKHKAESGDMTAEEYKDYYTTGYKTDVDHIEIKDNMIQFTRGEETVTGEYEYEGYKILTYESGKKGVRYLFTKVGGDESAPETVQFSDHEIAPTKVGHYHIYFGDESHEEMLEEMDHWPTYYPADMNGEEIKEEMLHH